MGFAIACSIIIPMIGAMGIYVTRSKPNGPAISSVVAAIALVASVIHLMAYGARDVVDVVSFFPGISVSFFCDPLSLIFAMVASSLWGITVLYSVGYLNGAHEKNQPRFFACVAIALGATMGVAFSANLLTLYIFYEMLSLSTYALVGHHQNDEARVGARKYLIYLFGGSIGLALPAMIAVYALTGTLSFSYAGILPEVTPFPVLVVLMIMFLYGFAKAGLMPFHAWLPGAMVAPTPVSSLLHAVAVVKVGVFSIVRVITGIFGYDLINQVNLSQVIVYIAAFTVIVASLMALYQDSLKRRLAFSTIGQLAYIIMGVGLATPMAFVGGVLHIVMHALGKITLFFCAGAIYVATKKKYVSQLDGIGRQMPWTMGAFFIGSLSVIGLPPTGGFISKWFMVNGALEAGFPVIFTVYLISSFLNACYFLPIVYRAFFKNPATMDDVAERPLLCVVPPVITAAMSVVLFVGAPFIIRLIQGIYYG